MGALTAQEGLGTAPQLVSQFLSSSKQLGLAQTELKPPMPHQPLVSWKYSRVSIVVLICSINCLYSVSSVYYCQQSWWLLGISLTDPIQALKRRDSMYLYGIPQDPDCHSLVSAR